VDRVKCLLGIFQKFDTITVGYTLKRLHLIFTVQTEICNIMHHTHIHTGYHAKPTSLSNGTPGSVYLLIVLSLQAILFICSG